ncbi:MAG: hypothetical protein WCR20_22510, partial [Verrucomicrobiota bacterium]
GSASAAQPWASWQNPVGMCAGEAGVNMGESPIRRIRLFTAENDGRAAAARRGRKQDIDWTGRP